MYALSSWRLSGALAATIAVCSTASFAQQGVDQALSKEQTRINQGAAAQDQIDSVHSETRKRIDEYKAVEKQIEGLETYLAQLDLQIRDQATELESVRESVAEVTVIERQITPLMLRMIDALEQFVALDMPFLQEQRSDRVGRLQQMMGSADVTVAEKFRNVMNAYEIELEYGNTIEAYRGALAKADGAGKEVDFLRIGRLGLFYQSLDGSENGRWNGDSGAWEALDAAYSSQIQQGIRIAREQTAPDLIRLPIQTAEAQP